MRLLTLLLLKPTTMMTAGSQTVFKVAAEFYLTNLVLQEYDRLSLGKMI